MSRAEMMFLLSAGIILLIALTYIVLLIIKDYREPLEHDEHEDAGVG